MVRRKGNFTRIMYRRNYKVIVKVLEFALLKILSFYPSNVRVCLITVFSLYFLFSKQFSIFEIKKLVWQTQNGLKTKIVLKTQICEEN